MSAGYDIIMHKLPQDLLLSFSPAAILPSEPSANRWTDQSTDHHRSQSTMVDHGWLHSIIADHGATKLHFLLLFIFQNCIESAMTMCHSLNTQNKTKSSQIKQARLRSYFRNSKLYLLRLCIVLTTLSLTWPPSTMLNHRRFAFDTLSLIDRLFLLISLKISLCS